MSPLRQCTRVCAFTLPNYHIRERHEYYKRQSYFDKYLCPRLRHNSIMDHFAVTDYAAHYRFHEGLEL